MDLYWQTEDYLKTNMIIMDTLTDAEVTEKVQGRTKKPVVIGKA